MSLFSKLKISKIFKFKDKDVKVEAYHQNTEEDEVTGVSVRVFPASQEVDLLQADKHRVHCRLFGLYVVDCTPPKLPHCGDCSLNK